MPKPDPSSKRHPATEPASGSASRASKPTVRVNDLPDRYPKAQGVAPPPTAAPTIPEAVRVPLAEPVAPFGFDATAAESPFAAEPSRAPVPPIRKPSRLRKILLTLVLAASAVAIFFIGWEFGSRRTARRYEAALKNAETRAAALVPKSDATKPEAKKSAEVRPPSTKPEATKKAETSKSEATKPADTPKSATLVKFEQVQPIFQQKCFSCHRDKPRKGELDTRTIASLLKGGESGAAVKPGDLNGSLLWEYISTNKMPPAKSNRLTAEEKALIRDWISGGAK